MTDDVVRRPQASAGRKAVAARAHLERGRAAVAAEDWGATAVWLNAAAQAALDAVAMREGIDTTRNAHRRAAVGRALHMRGILSRDVLPLMVRLNDERKHVLYEGVEPDIRGRSWEEVLDEVAELVAAAERSLGN